MRVRSADQITKDNLAALAASTAAADAAKGRINNNNINNNNNNNKTRVRSTKLAKPKPTKRFNNSTKQQPMLVGLQQPRRTINSDNRTSRLSNVN